LFVDRFDICYASSIFKFSFTLVTQ
jgi:hypothetical protein